MSYSQPSITDFAGTDTDTDTTTQPESKDESDLQHGEPESDTTGETTNSECDSIEKSEPLFDEPPEEYPQAAIDDLEKEEIKLNLCVPDDTVSVTFSTIAGRGGMGPSTAIDHIDAVYALGESFNSLPVAITGGGMSSPMGAGLVVGQLLDIERVDNTVSIEYDEIYRMCGRQKDKTHTKHLGAYELSVPKTAEDCQNAIKALEAWESGEIEYLDPQKRHKERIKTECIDAFETLSPGDQINTPAYATTLTVVSEPFETHAIIPRGTLKNKTVEVLSVTVNNPRGGYYQIGMSPAGSHSRYISGPVCYISGSHKTPPRPNTAFRRDSKFAATDVDITTADPQKDVDVVEPDKEVLKSPLPEPAIQTPLDEIDGIGEKTARKINRITASRATAESVAYAIFGDGDIHRESLRRIRKTLTSLPRKKKIFRQLKTYTPENGEE